MKFIIHRQRHVWMWTFVLILFQLSLAHGFIYLTFGPELYRIGIIGITILPILLAFPVGYFSGMQLLRLNRMKMELEDSINHDHLTRVMTRERFVKETSMATITQGVVLMADIDHFKSINDTYGHHAGDLVLKKVAEIMGASVREGDLLSRFGGEEFALFLPNAEIGFGWSIAERMRSNVAESPICVEGLRVDVSISIGYTFKPPGIDIQAALKAADRGLYAAKNGGRNQSIQSAVGRQDITRPRPSSNPGPLTQSA